MNIFELLSVPDKDGKLKCWMASTEKPGTFASNSEIRRWVKQNQVWINGEPFLDVGEQLDFPLTSIIIHPKNPKVRVTWL